MRILTIVGTRPQLIKAAALSPELRARHQEIFVDTGQHYDEALAGVFFRELGLPKPDYSLGAGSGSHAEQTSAILRALGPIIADRRPDAVLVYGDTNSTLAGALVAAKMDVPVAHVEAGLRSFDRRMPEEVNRVVVDHLSRWLFAPTATAVDNLAAEGITHGVQLVGDLMRDLAARLLPQIRDSSALADVALADLDLQPGRYLFATIHRAENRSSGALQLWAALLRAVATPDRRVVLAIHPGTRQALQQSGQSLGPNVQITEPFGYRSSLTLQLHAAAVLTDSGGVQREAGWLGTPCLVLRTTTEWVELLAASDGRMVLIGLDANRAVQELTRLTTSGSAGALAAARADGIAVIPAGVAEAIVDHLSIES